MNEFTDPVLLLKSRVDLMGTQAALAQEIGISAQYLSQILARERDPSEKVLDYLNFEKVIMYRPRKEEEPTKPDRRSRNRRRA